MKLISLGALSSLYVASATVESGIEVTCNDDNTLEFAITYDHVAEILEFNYGSCNLDSIRDSQKAQDSDLDFTFSLDVSTCDMDSNLRTLQYNQTADIRLGRKAGAQEITLAHFDVDATCEYTHRYTVTFNYNTITSEAHQFDQSGGLIGLNFEIDSYNSLFNETAAAPNTGGETIYLGLKLDEDLNEGFDHAEHYLNSRDGKVFVVERCSVSDTGNNIEFTLFDAAPEDSNVAATCGNEHVNLIVGCEHCVDAVHDADHVPMWTIQHTLFLLGDHKESTFQLSCDVLVCDMQKSDDCNAVLTVCEIGV
jgi:type VI protein secretion system component Hcp